MASTCCTAADAVEGVQIDVEVHVVVLGTPVAGGVAGVGLT